MHYSTLGVAFISLEWCFLALELTFITIRVYSRTFLTRSVGSDDLFIVIACLLDIAGDVIDLKSLLTGLAQHQTDLTKGQYAEVIKWEYLSYITGYIEFFFVRASVALFVLRLLPSYKKWQPRVVYVVLAINFLVTVYACTTWGVSCIPLRATWEDVPNAKCLSKDLLAITNQVHGALACVCDLATALIPQFLLWNVQMKPKTKQQLNIIFGLGVLTAGLSIGRAATLTKKSVSDDVAWRIMPSYFFGMIETELGVLLACAPALRQFWAYRTRVGSSLPTTKRQQPNEDFEKMRFRVNARDVFWYRQAQTVSDRVLDATPIFRSESPPPNIKNGDPSSTVKNSVLDSWYRRVRNSLRISREQKDPLTSSSKAGAGTGISSEHLEKRNTSDTSQSSDLSSKEHLRKHGQGWFLSGSKTSHGTSSRGTFLESATRHTTSSLQDEPL